MKKFYTTQLFFYLKSTIFNFVNIFLLIFSVLISSNVEARNGSDILYKQLDSFKFEITINVYSYCSGVSSSKPAMSVVCDNNANSMVNIASIMHQVSARDITNTCKSEPPRCVPNQAFTGDGVQEIKYVGIFDMDSTPYNGFKNCDKLKITVSQCCRPSNITTGAANSMYFNYAELDLRYGFNNSPVFTVTPKMLLPLNEPWYYNIGAIDTLDNDSLSFHWAEPMSSLTQTISYTGQHLAYDHPFSAYYPTNLGPPTAIPNGFSYNRTPIGIYLNPSNGDVVFTPVRASQRTVAVFEVKKWRKIDVTLPNGNSSTEFKHIGSVRRDMSYSVENSPGNNPPIIIADKSDFEICEDEELCFNIETFDRRYIDPVTGQMGKLDTLTLTWDKTISDASFRILDDTARFPEAEFCWTPKIGVARDLPYTFRAIVQDDACPLISESIKAFTIKVNSKTETERTYNNIGCGKVAIKTKSLDSNSNIKKISWWLTDINGNSIEKKLPLFLSSNRATSSSISDTIQFYKSGKYLIYHQANNCNVHMDTIEVTPFTEMQLSETGDTFLCTSNTLVLSPFLNNADMPLSYRWGTTFINSEGQIQKQNATFLAKDSLSTFELSMGQNTDVTAVGLTISDNAGCSQTDFVKIFKKKVPKVTIPNVPAICFGEKTEIEVQFTNLNDSSVNAQWYFQGNAINFDDFNKIQVDEKGWYVVRFQDVFGCGGLDSFQLKINDELTVSTIGEKRYCFGQKTDIAPAGLDTVQNEKSGSYVWSEILNNIPIPLNISGKLELDAFENRTFLLEMFVTENGVTCTTSKEIEVLVQPLPQLTMPAEELVIECIGYTLPNLVFGDYFSESGGNGQRYFAGNVISESTRMYIYSKEGICENEVSFDIIIRDLPELDILEDVLACDQFVLPSLRRGNYFDEPNGEGNQLSAGDVISDSRKLYIFNRNSCGIREVSFDIIVNPNPTSAFQISNDILIAEEENAEYQWLDCQNDKTPISGAIFKELSPEKSGVFALEVTKDGCTDISDCINFTHSSISDLEKLGIQVFPNPNSGRFVIDFGHHQNVSIKLFDVSGKLLLEENILTLAQKEIDIKGANGVYLLEIKIDSKIHYVKVVKQ